jgi:hypothetical protein
MVASYGQHIGPDYAGWARGDWNSDAKAATFELLCAWEKKYPIIIH